MVLPTFIEVMKLELLKLFDDRQISLVDSLFCRFIEVKK